MDTSKEIRSNIKNLQYYAEEIQKLTKAQFQKDVDVGHLLGIDVGAGTIRFDSIGAIQSAAEWVKVYCENMENNLKSAERQDRKLIPQNQKEGEENES